jgi:HK97 family phage prohead protease
MNEVGIRAVQHRLFGGGNRIAWRAADIAKIADRFGVAADKVPDVMPARTPASESLPITKAEETGKNEFTFTISTAAVDRMGDTIALSGWNLDNYRKNPVVLWMHDNFLVPVGRAPKVWREGDKLKSTVQLVPRQISAAADRVRGLIADGYLCATSVGFNPLKYAFADDPARRYGIDFLEQELLEWSIVTVPANPQCLIDPGQQQGKSQRQRELEKRQREIDVLRLRGTTL